MPEYSSGMDFGVFLGSKCFVARAGARLKEGRRRRSRLLCILASDTNISVITRSRKWMKVSLHGCMTGWMRTKQLRSGVAWRSTEHNLDAFEIHNIGSGPLVLSAAPDSPSSGPAEGDIVLN